MKWLKWPDNVPENPIDKEYILRYTYANRYNNNKIEVNYDKAIFLMGWICPNIADDDEITHFCEITEP